MKRLIAIAFCGVMAAACGGSPPVEGPSVEGPAQMHGVKMYLNQEGLQARYPDYDTLAGELQDAGVDALFTTPYEGKTAFYASEILPEREWQPKQRASEIFAVRVGCAFSG